MQPQPQQPLRPPATGGSQMTAITPTAAPRVGSPEAHAEGCSCCSAAPPAPWRTIEFCPRYQLGEIDNLVTEYKT